MLQLDELRVFTPMSMLTLLPTRSRLPALGRGVAKSPEVYFRHGEVEWLQGRSVLIPQPSALALALGNRSPEELETKVSDS